MLVSVSICDFMYHVIHRGSDGLTVNILFCIEFLAAAMIAYD